MDKEGVPVRKRRSTIMSICNITKSAVQQWYDGTTKNIEYKNLKALADRFDTTVEHLTGSDVQQISESEALNRRLFALWDQLNDHDKKVFLASIEMISKISPNDQP